MNANAKSSELHPLRPVVGFNYFTTPAWFIMIGTSA